MPAAGTDRCITAPRMAEVFLRSFTTAFGRSCRGQISMKKSDLQGNLLSASVQPAYDAGSIRTGHSFVSIGCYPASCCCRQVSILGSTLMCCCQQGSRSVERSPASTLRRCGSGRRSCSRSA